MKNTICSLLLLFGVFVLTSNRSGRANRIGQGVTGAPGELGQTCASVGCHFSGAFDPDVVISLLDQNSEIVNSYLPNQSYSVQLKINHTGFPTGYGFQIVSLLDSDNSGINTFANLNSQMQEIMVGNRQYVEQNNIINSDLITLNWTAPDEGSGPISFYGIGNAVNGNGEPSGDGASSATLSISEEIMSSNSNFIDGISMNIFPNPAIDFIKISAELDIKSVSLFNIQGQMVLSTEDVKNNIKIENLNAGFYLIQVLFSNNKVASQKFIVSK